VIWVRTLQALERRVVPFLIDRWAPSELIRASWKYAPKPPSGVVDAAGFRFDIDPRGGRPNDAALYYHGTYEAGTVQVLSRVAAGGIVIDAGAHIGAIALPLSGYASHVHAFEPHPRTHAVLEANVRRNGLSNVTAHHAAIGVADGAGMVTDLDNAAGNTLADGTGSIPVPVRSLDSLAGEYGPPTAIKLDVEGWELDALKGGERLLASGDAPALCVESSTIGAGDRSGVMEWILDVNDYRVFRLSRGKDTRSDLVPFDGRMPRHDNLFYLRPSHMGAVL